MERFGCCWMTTLPSELLEHIFHFLPGNALCHVRLVCHRWREIVNGCRALWSRLAIVLKRNMHKDSYYIRQDFRPPPLVPVSSFTFEYWGIECVAGWWFDFGRKLTQLTLCLCNVKIKILLEMLKQTPHLVGLRLKGVLFQGNASAPPDFRLDRMKQLQMERLCFEVMTISDLLGAFVDAFPMLVEFKLWHPTRLEVLQWVIKRLQGTLQQLDVIVLNVEDNALNELVFQRPTDSLLPDLCRLEGLRLKRISLDVTVPFVVEHWIQLFKAQPGIEELILHIYHSLILIEIAEVSPTIKALTLFPHRSLGLHALNSFEQLERLEIHGCSYGFNALDLGRFDGVVSPKLKALHLISQNLFGILEYLAQCPLIERMLLKRCRIEERINIAPTTFANIQYLNLSDCAIERSVLLFIFNSSPGLDHVRLFRTTNVDDQVIRLLCRRAPKLRKLELEEQRSVTDSAGVHIIRHALKLEELRLFQTSLTRTMLERLRHCRFIRASFSLSKENDELEIA